MADFKANIPPAPLASSLSDQVRAICATAASGLGLADILDDSLVESAVREVQSIDLFRGAYTLHTWQQVFVVREFLKSIAASRLAEIHDSFKVLPAGLLQSRFDELFDDAKPELGFGAGLTKWLDPRKWNINYSPSNAATSRA